MKPRFVALGAVALSLAAASAVAPVTAQTPTPTSTPISLPSLPPSINPYVKDAIDLLTGVVNHQLQVNANSGSGTVSYFKRFEMQIQTGRNSYRSIHLHQGTVINPTGESITVGQHVDVSGVSQPDGSLAANTITIDH
jgi:hypothetical protein